MNLEDIITITELRVFLKDTPGSPEQKRRLDSLVRLYYSPIRNYAEKWCNFKGMRQFAEDIANDYMVRLCDEKIEIIKRYPEKKVKRLAEITEYLQKEAERARNPVEAKILENPNQPWKNKKPQPFTFGGYLTQNFVDFAQNRLPHYCGNSGRTLAPDSPATTPQPTVEPEQSEVLFDMMESIQIEAKDMVRAIYDKKEKLVEFDHLISRALTDKGSHFPKELSVEMLAKKFRKSPAWISMKTADLRRTLLRTMDELLRAKACDGLLPEEAYDYISKNISSMLENM